MRVPKDSTQEVLGSHFWSGGSPESLKHNTKNLGTEHVGADPVAASMVFRSYNDHLILAPRPCAFSRVEDPDTELHRRTAGAEAAGGWDSLFVLGLSAPPYGSQEV